MPRDAALSSTQGFAPRMPIGGIYSFAACLSESMLLAPKML
jgi:hypothetical protein